MQVVDYRLRLNLLTNGSQGSIRVKRGENGARRLIVRLYTDSSPYIPGEGVTAVFRAKKPDSTILYNDATINDNTVTVDLTTQTVASAGAVTCELSLYGTNNELLYSPQFDVIVEDYLYSDSEIESTSEYTALTEAVSTVNDIKTTEAARADAETARVAAETERENAEAERVAAETERETAEAERVTAENTRVSAETTRKTLYNQWANATASAYESLEPYVRLYNVGAHKEFVFGLPSISKERNTIETTELKNLARKFTGFVFYQFPLGLFDPEDLPNYDLPNGINETFILSTGPLETTVSWNRLHSYAAPQTIFDGQNIYMRRLGITEEGTGSEADPIIVTYSDEAWQQVGESAATALAVTKAQATADNATTAAANAQTAADEAASKATTAQSKADSAATAASNAQSTADAAKTTATAVDTKAGNLSDLTTTDKSSLVAAINEAAKSGLPTVTTADDGKVLTVENGAWAVKEASGGGGSYYTLTVTCTTQDGVTVTGQTVTITSGGAVFATAEYNGQPVSFAVPDGLDYKAEVSDTLEKHFTPSTVIGVINKADQSVILTYNDFSTITTAQDIKDALNAGLDLTELVGAQINCTRGSDTIVWDVVDYTDNTITLLMHSCWADNMQLEPTQAMMYATEAVPAGDYYLTKHGGSNYYFTLTAEIPKGGQMMFSTSSFTVYNSQSDTAAAQTGTVSTTAIEGATQIGESGTGNFNHWDRAQNGSNNYGESALHQWLNSDAGINQIMPFVTIWQRPYRANKGGFMYTLDPDFVAALDDTEWKCSTNQWWEAPASAGGISKANTAYTVTSKFALASEMEIFGSYGGIYAGDAVFDAYDGATAAERIKYRGTSASTWWLRSPYWNHLHDGRYVTGSGGVSDYGARISTGVVAACKISKSS